MSNGVWPPDGRKTMVASAAASLVQPQSSGSASASSTSASTNSSRAALGSVTIGRRRPPCRRHAVRNAQRDRTYSRRGRDPEHLSQGRAGLHGQFQCRRYRAGRRTDGRHRGGSGQPKQVTRFLVVDEGRQQEFSVQMGQPGRADLLLDRPIDGIGPQIVGPYPIRRDQESPCAKDDGMPALKLCTSGNTVFSVRTSAACSL